MLPRLLACTVPSGRESRAIKELTGAAAQRRAACMHDGSCESDAPLAGLGHVNSADIEDSGRFLRRVFRARLAEAEAGRAELVAAGARLSWLLSPAWAPACRESCGHAACW